MTFSVWSTQCRARPVGNSSWYWILLYSCTHVLMYSFTHMYSCTHVLRCTPVLLYSCTHVLMYSGVLMYSCTPVLMYSCTTGCRALPVSSSYCRRASSTEGMERCQWVSSRCIYKGKLNWRLRWRCADLRHVRGGDRRSLPSTTVTMLHVTLSPCYVLLRQLT